MSMTFAERAITIYAYLARAPLYQRMNFVRFDKIDKHCLVEGG